jgi:hypothetical protein
LQGVGLEGAPREDDLVAGAGGGEHELLQQRDGAGPDEHALGGEAVAVGERAAQAGRGGVRVAVDGGRGGEGLEHRGQRVEGVLVGGELVRARGRLTALLVGREGRDLGAEGHLGRHLATL